MSRSFSVPIQGQQIPTKISRTRNDFKQRSTCSDIQRAKRLVVEELILGTTTITAPADTRFEFPPDEGTNGQVLTTDGNGGTYWSSSGGGGLDPTVNNLTVLSDLDVTSITSSSGIINFNQADLFNINQVSTETLDTSTIINSTGSGISFGSENLTTTGTVKAAVLDAPTIINSTGLGINFQAENLSTTGDVAAGRIDSASITNTQGTDIQFNSKNITNVANLSALMIDTPSITNTAGPSINMNSKTLTNLGNLQSTAGSITTLTTSTVTSTNPSIDFSGKGLTNVGAVSASSLSVGSFSAASLDVQTITNSSGTAISFGSENISTTGAVSGTTITAGTSISTPTITSSAASIGFSNKNLTGVLSIDTPTITNSAGSVVAFSKPITTSQVGTASGNLSLNPAGTAVDLNGKQLINAVITGMGDVSGPVSSTLNGVARYSDLTGKVIKDSPVTIGDTGAVAGVTTLTASTSVTTPQIVTASGNLVLNPAGTSVDFSGKTIINAVIPGNGNVAGPGSATDNALARFDGTTGGVIQNSTATLSDTGVLLGLTSLETSTITATGDLVINPTGTNVDFSGKTILNAVIPGGGNVAGPLSSVDNAVVRFNGTTGDLIQESPVIISDLGAVTGVSSIQTPSITTASGNLSINPTGTAVDFNGKQIINAVIAGSGNVGGPVSSTNNAIALFDGTTGTLIKSSTITVDGSANATGFAQLSATSVSTPSITTSGTTISFNSKNLDTINSISTPTFTTSGTTISFSSKNLNSIGTLSATSVSTPTVSNGSGNLTFTASGNVSINPTGSIDFNSRPIINAVGVGDVSGPGVSTDGGVVVYSGVTGKIVKSCPVTIDGSGNALGFANMTVGGTLAVSTINPPSAGSLSLSGASLINCSVLANSLISPTLTASGSDLTLNATTTSIKFSDNNLSAIGTLTAKQVVTSVAASTSPSLSYELAGANSTYAHYNATVSTTTATPTDLQTLAVATNTVRFIDTTVVFKITSGANAGKGGRFRVTQSFNNISGTVTGNNITKESDVPSGVTADVNFAISGTSVVLRVTGVAATNITWSSDSYTGFI